MTHAFRGLALVTAAAGLAGCAGGGSANLETFTDSASYAVGMNMGTSINNAGVEVSLDVLVQGIHDAVDEKTALTEGEARQLLSRFAQEAQAAQAARQQADGEANQVEGEAFLQENGERPEVTTTASGLQYEVLEAGTGPRPAATDRVRVHYRGTFIDGTQFDASNPDGVAFALDRVIPGWTEGVQLMPVGSKYKFYVPADLAYGPNGSPPNIGPNATLIFEVELLAIEQSPSR